MIETTNEPPVLPAPLDQTSRVSGLVSRPRVRPKLPTAHLAGQVTVVQAHVPPPIPSSRRPTRLMALVNQKGGVGKTTTTVNLAEALSRLGQRVLAIDLDPQSHLTLHMGIEPEALDKSIYHLLTDPEVSALEVAHEVHENLVVVPAEVNLAGVEAELASFMASGRAQRVLADKCAPLLTDPRGEPVFDYVLIDCPPSLGLLTINALALAREVMVPMQAHFLALQGLSKLLETVTLVKQAVNSDLVVSGMILCMHESQTLLAGEVLADLNAFLDAARDQDVPWRDALVFGPPIRRNIKLAECPSFGKTIFDYAPLCPGANDYHALAQAVVAQAAARVGHV